MKLMNWINDELLSAGIDHVKQKDACAYFRNKPIMFTGKVALGTNTYKHEVESDKGEDDEDI